MGQLENSAQADEPAAQPQPLTLEQKVTRALAHADRAANLKPMAVFSPTDLRRTAITANVHAKTEAWLNGGLDK